MQDIATYIKELRDNQASVLIVSHHNPDGDAVGSALALTNYFNALGLKARCALPNQFPPFLRWLEGAGDILVYSENGDILRKFMTDVDAVFCLDFNALHRLHDLEKPIRESSARLVMIDHHPNPEPDFHQVYSRTDTSSTAELIYDLIMEIDGGELVTKEIAECLYVGIMTDTGSFSFACDHASTFSATAFLIEKGISTERVHRLVYDTYSESRMRLLGYCLSEKLVLLPEYEAGYISLTKDELQKFNYESGDTEGVVNYALSIKGIKVAALFTERKNLIRISFRSKGSFAVNEIARHHYDGGGHRNAAGGNSYVPMEESLERFRRILAQYKDEIINSSDA